MAALTNSVDMVLALPIEGEAFLLRRAGRTVLVDGGYKKDKIADVLAKSVRDVTFLDVIVCTHGDADHAGGLPALLNGWTNRVRQVWLPGRWVNVIPALATDPTGFLKKLIEELDAELQEPSDDVYRLTRENDEALEESTRTVIEPELWAEFDGLEGDDLGPEFPEGPIEPDWFSSLRRAVDELASDDLTAKAFVAARRKVLRRQRRGADKKIAHYWLQLIDTAEAIRGIAVAAIKHNIATRWFDFDGFAQNRRASGGVRGFLVPINCVEQASAPTYDLFYLQLTQINRESLVFLAPPSLNRLGVLFCADSPLGDGQNYTRSFLPSHPHTQFWPIVATAPHHGSESNSIAYTHLQGWADILVLLRAGGTKKHPGATFLGQNYCLRLCAKCPMAGHKPLLTGVFASGYWPLIATGRRCDCAYIPRP